MAPLQSHMAILVRELQGLPGPGERVRVRQGWGDAGRTGVCLASPVEDRYGLEWTVVEWDDEDVRDVHKTSGLEVFERQYW